MSFVPSVKATTFGSPCGHRKFGIQYWAERASLPGVQQWNMWAIIQLNLYGFI